MIEHPQRYLVNVEAAVLNAGRYLMVIRSEYEAHAPGTIALPGGKVEGVSTVEGIIEETLRREVFEEAGVTLDDEMHYVRNNAFVTDDGEPVVNVVFLCRYASGELKISDPDEVAGLFWMTPAEMDADPRIPPWTKTNVELAERVRREHHL